MFYKTDIPEIALVIIYLEQWEIMYKCTPNGPIKPICTEMQAI